MKDYIMTISSNTRASSKNHVKRSHSHIPRLRSTKFLYFNRVINLWNSLPYIDLTQLYSSIKSQLFLIFWNYFLRHYNLLYAIVLNVLIFRLFLFLALTFRLSIIMLGPSMSHHRFSSPLLITALSTPLQFYQHKFTLHKSTIQRFLPL